LYDYRSNLTEVGREVGFEGIRIDRTTPETKRGVMV
jgi:hypothetical protein